MCGEIKPVLRILLILDGSSEQFGPMCGEIKPVLRILLIFDGSSEQFGHV